MKAPISLRQRFAEIMTSLGFHDVSSMKWEAIADSLIIETSLQKAQYVRGYFLNWSVGVRRTEGRRIREVRRVAFGRNPGVKRYAEFERLMDLAVTFKSTKATDALVAAVSEQRAIILRWRDRRRFLRAMRSPGHTFLLDPDKWRVALSLFEDAG